MFFKKLAESLKPITGDGLTATFSLANSYRRVGRIGFWAQIIAGALPVLLMGYVFTFNQSTSGTRAGLPLVSYLTVASFLILLFTIYWFRRYIGIGARLEDPAQKPTQGSLIGTVWTGVVASILGILFSMVVMLVEVSHLLFYFLSAPQGGVPVVQALGPAQASWVSAVDLMSLLSLMLTLGAEVAVLALGLWLLFRTSQATAEFAS